MATWNPPSDANLAAGKPATQDRIRAIRDLSPALAERAAGSPWVNEAGAQVFLTTAGPSIWAVPDGVYRILVTMIGGGGAGAGVDVQTDLGGGGGGAGATRIVLIEVTPGQSWGYTVGAGGAGSASQDADDGDDTVFGTYTIGGGGGANDDDGGDGGFGSFFGSTLLIKGARGGNGIITGLVPPNDVIISGAGGDSSYGPGAPPVGTDNIFNRAVGLPGRGYGSGGSGGAKTADIDNGFGGDGADGAILIRY